MAMPPSPAQAPPPAPRPAPGAVTGRLTAWADRHRWLLLVLVVAAYLLAFNGQFRGQPDAGLHLTIARSLYMGDGFAHPLGDEVRANPGLAYLLAGTMHLGGPEPFALANAVMLGIGLATLGLAFVWFRFHLGRPTAVLLTAVLGLSLTFFEYTHHLMTDIPFLMGAMLFLLGWDRLLRHRAPRPVDLLLLVAGTGVMVAFRTVAITFLGAVVLALLWHMFRSSDRRLWISGGVLVAVCLAGLAAAVITSHGTANDTGPSIVADTQIIAGRLQNLGTTLTEDVPTNLRRLVFNDMTQAVTGVRIGALGNALVGLTAVGLGLALFRRHALGGLLVLAFIVQTLLFLVTERYYLAILPLLLLGWWHGACWFERRGRWWGLAVCGGLLVVWIVPNVIRTGDFIAKQRQTPFLEHHGGGRYGAQFAMRDWLRDGPGLPEPATIVTDHRDQHVMVYLTMPLDVTVTTHRHVRAGEVPEGDLYVLEPMGPGMERLIRRQDWRLGEPVLTVPTRRASQTIRLRPVVAPEAGPVSD